MPTLFYDLWERLSIWLAELLEARWFFYYKIIVGIISAWLLFCAMVLLIKINSCRQIRDIGESLRASKLPKRFEKKWQKILKDLAGNQEASWKLAVIEADNLFDSILKRMALPGKDMGERLSVIKPAQLKSLNEIWEAHKLRNRIVHEESLRLTRAEAEEAVKKIQVALEELGVL